MERYNKLNVKTPWPWVDVWKP